MRTSASGVMPWRRSGYQYGPIDQLDPPGIGERRDPEILPAVHDRRVTGCTLAHHAQDFEGHALEPAGDHHVAAAGHER